MCPMTVSGQKKRFLTVGQCGKIYPDRGKYPCVCSAWEMYVEIKVSDTGKEFQRAIRHLFSRGFTGKKRFIISRVLESDFI